jgi:NADH:ubiquinone oxidoreductase subunit 6 (subunit J)
MCAAGDLLHRPAALLLHSPFLALMEILIYVGAVCVTIVFW